MSAPGLTVSSQELGWLLDCGDAPAAIVRRRFHRTLLWRLATGARLPNLRTAVELEQLTRGRVPCAGWFRRPRSR